MNTKQTTAEFQIVVGEEIENKCKCKKQLQLQFRKAFSILLCRHKMKNPHYSVLRQHASDYGIC